MFNFPSLLGAIVPTDHLEPYQEVAHSLKRRLRQPVGQCSTPANTAVMLLLLLWPQNFHKKRKNKNKLCAALSEAFPPSSRPCVGDEA